MTVVLIPIYPNLRTANFFLPLCTVFQLSKINEDAPDKHKMICRSRRLTSQGMRGISSSRNPLSWTRGPLNNRTDWWRAMCSATHYPFCLHSPNQSIIFDRSNKSLSGQRLVSWKLSELPLEVRSTCWPLFEGACIRVRGRWWFRCSCRFRLSEDTFRFWAIECEKCLNWSGKEWFKCVIFQAKREGISWRFGWD